MPDAPPPPLAAAPSLAADDLGHAFGARALYRGVSFRLGPGEALAITGANGAGKTTLVRVLAGLLAPRKGHITLALGGAPVPEADRARYAGLVAPYAGVYDGLTPREHLAFLARARGFDPATFPLGDVLARVDLAARADDRVGTFSSGLKQRVKYACALLAAPPLLLLDEPTTNLDARGAEIVAGIRAWQLARGGLLVVATNDPAEAAGCGQEVRVGE